LPLQLWLLNSLALLQKHLRVLQFVGANEKGYVPVERTRGQTKRSKGFIGEGQAEWFGTEYLKWLLIFGDEKESVVIAATFPQQLDRDLSEKMKASILTATWDRKKDVSPTEDLNFRVDAKGELKLAKRVANLLVFSKGGIFPSKDVDDPIFIVGQSVSKMEMGNPEEFAKARILQTAEITDVEIEQSNKVTIDHLSGYEIVAKAKDKASARPMLVYQVMLFDAQTYFLMQGLISDTNHQLNLEVFKEMARTFHRKIISYTSRVMCGRSITKPADGAAACFSSNLNPSRWNADRAPQLKAGVRRP
jgi:hypothetical protein